MKRRDFFGSLFAGAVAAPVLAEALGKTSVAKGRVISAGGIEMTENTMEVIHHSFIYPESMPSLPASDGTIYGKLKNPVKAYLI